MKSRGILRFFTGLILSLLIPMVPAQGAWAQPGGLQDLVDTQIADINDHISTVNDLRRDLADLVDFFDDELGNLLNQNDFAAILVDSENARTAFEELCTLDIAGNSEAAYLDMIDLAKEIVDLLEDITDVLDTVNLDAITDVNDVIKGVADALDDWRQDLIDDDLVNNSPELTEELGARLLDVCDETEEFAAFLEAIRTLKDELELGSGLQDFKDDLADEARKLARKISDLVNDVNATRGAVGSIKLEFASATIDDTFFDTASGLLGDAVFEFSGVSGLLFSLVEFFQDPDQTLAGIKSVLEDEDAFMVDGQQDLRNAITELEKIALELTQLTNTVTLLRRDGSELDFNWGFADLLNGCSDPRPCGNAVALRNFLVGFHPLDRPSVFGTFGVTPGLNPVAAVALATTESVDFGQFPVLVELSFDVGGGVPDSNPFSDLFNGTFSAAPNIQQAANTTRNVTLDIPVVPSGFAGTIRARLFSTNTGILLDEATKSVSSCETPWYGSAVIASHSPNPLASVSQRFFDFFTFPQRQQAASDNFFKNFDIYAPGASITLTADPTFSFSSLLSEDAAGRLNSGELFCRKTDILIKWFIEQYLPFEDTPTLLGQEGGGGDPNAPSATGETFSFNLAPGIFLIDGSVEVVGEVFGTGGIRDRVANLVAPAPDVRVFDYTSVPAPTGQDEIWTLDLLNPTNFAPGNTVPMGVKLSVANFDFFQLSDQPAVAHLYTAQPLAEIAIGEATITQALSGPISPVIPGSSNQFFDGAGTALASAIALATDTATFPVLAQEGAPQAVAAKLIPNTGQLDLLQVQNELSAQCQPLWLLSKLDLSTGEFALALITLQTEVLLEIIQLGLPPFGFEYTVLFTTRLLNLLNNESFLSINPVIAAREDRLIISTDNPVTLALNTSVQAMARDGSDLGKVCPAALNAEFDFDDNSDLVPLSGTPSGDDSLLNPLTKTIELNLSADHQYREGNFEPKLKVFLTGIEGEALEYVLKTGSLTATDNPVILEIGPTLEGVFVAPLPNSVCNEVGIDIDWNGNTPQSVTYRGNWPVSGSKEIVLEPGTSPSINALFGCLTPAIGSPDLDNPVAYLNMSLLGGTATNPNILEVAATGLRDGRIQDDVDTENNTPLDTEFLAAFPVVSSILASTQTVARVDPPATPTVGTLAAARPLPGGLDGLVPTSVAALAAERPLPVAVHVNSDDVVARVAGQLQSEINDELQKAFANAPASVYENPAAFQGRIDQALANVSMDKPVLIGRIPVTQQDPKHFDRDGEENPSDSFIQHLQVDSSAPSTSSISLGDAASFTIEIDGETVVYEASANLGSSSDAEDNTPDDVKMSKDGQLGGGKDQKKDSGSARPSASAEAGFEWDSAAMEGKLSSAFSLSWTVPLSKKPEAEVTITMTTVMGLTLADLIALDGTFLGFTILVEPAVSIPITNPFALPISADISGAFEYSIELSFSGFFGSFEGAEDSMAVELELYAKFDLGIISGGPFGGGGIESSFLPEPAFVCAFGYFGIRIEIDFIFWSTSWEQKVTWKTGTCSPESNILIDQPGEFMVDTGREYAGPGYAVFVDLVTLPNAFGVRETRLIENAFPRSDPQLISNGDTFVLVWVQDDVDKPVFEGRELWVSTAGSDFQFSQPQRITVDFLQDAAPSLAFDAQGNVVMVWNRGRSLELLRGIDVDAFAENFEREANKAIAIRDETELFGPHPLQAQETDIPSFEEVFSTAEVAYAVLDLDSGTWSEPTFLTDNSVLDQQPVLVQDETGALMVVWVQDPSNLPYPLTVPAPPVTLLSAAWESANGRFAEPIVLREGDRAIDRDFAYRDGRLLYAWHEDGQISAGFFIENTLGEVTVLDDSGNAPSAAFSPEGVPLLVWLHTNTNAQGTLDLMLKEASFTDAGWTVEDVALETGNAINSADLVQDAEGNVALIWSTKSQTQGKGTDLFTMIYDRGLGGWSTPRQLTNDQFLEGDLSTALVGDEVFVAYMKQALSFEDQTFSYTGPDSLDPDRFLEDEPYTIRDNAVFGASHLYVLQAGLDADLALTPEGVTLDPEMPAPGDTVVITVTVENVGRMGVQAGEGLVVELRDSPDGPVLETHSIDVLAMDDRATVQFTLELPGVAEQRVVYAVVNPDRAVEEATSDNNTVAIPVLTHDWRVDRVGFSFAQTFASGEALEEAVAETVSQAEQAREAGAEEAEVSQQIADALAPMITGEEVTFVVTVANHGAVDAPAGEVVFSFARDSNVFTARTRLGTAPLPALAAGQSAQLPFVWDVTALEDPSYRFFVTVGGPAGETTFEVDTANNERRRLVRRLPDLSVDAKVGDDNTLTATITNNGPVAATGVPVAVFEVDADGVFAEEPLLVLTAEEVAAFGGSVELTGSLPATTATKLVVVVNLGAAFSELDLSNNTATLNLTP